MRAAVRRFEPERVELSSNLVEVERTRERFAYDYLPEPIAHLLREALECYAADCHNAFALMCRRTVHASWRQLGGPARLRWHDLFQDVVAAGDLDAATTCKLERVLFGTDDNVPDVGAVETAVLIEVIKDLFYVCYVRGARLRAAVRMRRYFAGCTSPLEYECRAEEAAAVAAS
ncbi:MAG TPA: hypothetical protein VFY39_01105 [Gammaproteobacteria bacterium]|nr:hypothetical protein [Gammaproteobacteria bacterium]